LLDSGQREIDRDLVDCLDSLLDELLERGFGSGQVKDPAVWFALGAMLPEFAGVGLMALATWLDVRGRPVHEHLFHVAEP
jgi:hypothetical protein